MTSFLSTDTGSPDGSASPVGPVATASTSPKEQQEDREAVSPSSPFEAPATATSSASDRPVQAEAGTPGRTFGLDRGDRRFVTVVSVMALVLMSVHWLRVTGWSPSPVRVERPHGLDYRFVLDANTATWVEWMQLDGIGETLARRIVADLEEHGPFAEVDALERVPGIGSKTLERVRAHLVVHPPGSGTAP